MSGAERSVPAVPPLIGLATSKQIYVDGLAEIHFLGVNARYVLFSYQRDDNGTLFRKVEVTLLGPLGALPDAQKLITQFMTDHFMLPR